MEVSQSYKHVGLKPRDIQTHVRWLGDILLLSLGSGWCPHPAGSGHRCQSSALSVPQEWGAGQKAEETHVASLPHEQVPRNENRIWAIQSSLTFHSEKAMAPHSSTLAWKIPWMEKPGALQSVGSGGVGHDWATSLSRLTFMHWRRKWQPTPVFSPGESRDGGAWWAAVCGVAQSRTDWSDLAAAAAAAAFLFLLWALSSFICSEYAVCRGLAPGPSGARVPGAKWQPRHLSSAGETPWLKTAVVPHENCPQHGVPPNQSCPQPGGWGMESVCPGARTGTSPFCDQKLKPSSPSKWNLVLFYWLECP